MDILLIVIALLLALVVVVLVVALIRAKEAKGGDEELTAALENKIQQMQTLQRAETESLKHSFEEQRRRDYADFQQRIEQLQNQNSDRFKAISMQLIKTNTEELRTANSHHLEAVLTPLQANIESFRKAVNDAYVNENATRQSLRDRIDQLMQLNATLSSEASNLASALRGESKTQGDWGEMILRTLLEQCGLTEGIHFKEQLTSTESGETLRNEAGRALRPDVVVYLPDERSLIIDSKVTLTAYLDFNSATDASERSAALTRLIRSVKSHIDELATKKYQDYLAQAPDFVMMFIPVEGAYIAAIQGDSTLWQYAWERRVAIVSPAHLFSVMHIVTQLWRQDNHNRNALRIAEKGGRLHDKLVLFMDAFMEIDKGIGRTREAYDTALNRLSTGKGNVVKLTQELAALGATSSRKIPSAMADKAEADADASAVGKAEADANVDTPAS